MNHPTDIINGSMAVASLTIPWWLPLLKGGSEFAALIIPFLVVLYWAVKLALLLRSVLKGRHH